jgi:hypothetical protein
MGPIVVVIIGEHHVDFFPHKKGRFTMRKFFSCLRQRTAKSAYSSQLFFTMDRFVFAGSLDFNCRVFRYPSQRTYLAMAI